MKKQPRWWIPALLLWAGLATSCASAGKPILFEAGAAALDGRFSYQDNSPGWPAAGWPQAGPTPEGRVTVTIMSRVSLPKFWNRIKTLDPLEFLLVKSEIEGPGESRRTELTELAYRKIPGSDSQYYFGTKKSESELTVEFADTSLWRTSPDLQAPLFYGTWEGRPFSVCAVPETGGQPAKVESFTAFPPPGTKLTILDGDGNPVGELRREEGPGARGYRYHVAQEAAFSPAATLAILGYTTSLCACLATVQHYRFGSYESKMAGWPLGENLWEALFGEAKP